MLRLLRCVAQAAVKNSGKLLVGFVPGGEALYEIAIDAYQEYRAQHSADELRAEINALAAASAEQLQAEVKAAVKAVASDQSAEVQQQLTAYLTQIPASIRRSFRRHSDPNGATVPAGFAFDTREDLLRLLPSKATRFCRGQRPLLGLAWELEELLGVGGFGEVWLARHGVMKSKKPVALKFCLDPSAAKALRNEVGLLDHLQQHGNHRGIVRLQEAYLDNDPPCLQYEYCAGCDLAALLRERRNKKPISLEAACRMFECLVEAVAFAHRATPPIVHCDLKPANILVERRRDGKIQLRITDFGIGGLAAQKILEDARKQANSRHELLTGAVRGAYTPLYASPQQKSRQRGELADPRDDVHALGVIWYQLLTGDLNIDAIPTDWRDNLTDRGVPAAQADLLARCIASKAEKRPASAVALADELAILKDFVSSDDWEIVTDDRPARIARPPIVFYCPSCGAKLPELWLAGNVRCMSCYSVVTPTEHRPTHNVTPGLQAEIEAIEALARKSYMVTEESPRRSDAPKPSNEPPPIVFNCPNGCGKLEIPENLANKKVRCPTCRAVMVVSLPAKPSKAPPRKRKKAKPAADPEPTVLSCSHCEGLLYYDLNFTNQTVACPHCGNHLVMPNL